MKKLLGLLSLFVVFLAGCSSATTGAVYVFPTAEVEGMNTTTGSYSQTFQLWEDIYSGLFRVTGTGEVVPEVAESFELSDDQLVYTFKLREDAYWYDSTGEIALLADGSEAKVTANDFVYNWQRMVDPASKSNYAFIFESIKNGVAAANGEVAPTELGVKAIDDYTLEVTLEQPTPYFTSLLAFGAFYPANQEIVEASGTDYGQTAEATWYNGPFYVETYDPTFQIEVRKANNYFNADQVQLDGVNYKTMEDAAAIYNAFAQGEVDFTGFATTEEYEAAVAEGTATDSLTGYSFYVAMNTENEYLNDVTFRKALSYGFDRDSLTTALFGSKNEPLEYYVPKDLTTGSYNGVEYRDAAGESYGSFDQAKAQEYLETYMSANGITDPASINLKFLSSDAPASAEAAQAIQAMYEQTLGITITIEQLPSTSFYDEKDAGNYDLILTGWGADYADPGSYLGIFQSNVIDDGLNASRYASDAYDAAYVAANAETDTTKRMQGFADAEKILIEEDAAIIPFYQRNNAYMESEKYATPQLLFQKTSFMFTEVK